MTGTLDLIHTENSQVENHLDQDGKSTVQVKKAGIL